jgi:hypothetical protein
MCRSKTGEDRQKEPPLMASVTTIEVPRPPATTNNTIPTPIQVTTDLVFDAEGLPNVVYYAELSAASAKRFESSAIALGATGDQWVFSLSSTPTGGAALLHTVSYKQVSGDTLAKLIKRLVDEFNLFKDEVGSAVVVARAIAGNKIEITGRDGHALTISDGGSTTAATFTDLAPSSPGATAPIRGEIARVKVGMSFVPVTGIQKLSISYQFLDAATPPVGQPGYTAMRTQDFLSTKTMDEIMVERGIPRPTP